MPNPDYCGYDAVPYKCCRFAYTSLCPVCLDPHRRRSKSESLETTARKRTRALPTTYIANESPNGKYLAGIVMDQHPYLHPKAPVRDYRTIRRLVDERADLDKLKDVLGILKDVRVADVPYFDGYGPAQREDDAKRSRLRRRSNSDSCDAPADPRVCTRYCEDPRKPRTVVPGRVRLAEPPPAEPPVVSTAKFEVEVRRDPKKPPAKKREPSPPAPTKREPRARSAAKLAVSKSRQKFSAVKLRKVRSKIAHSVSSDSNLSDSDFSESEDDSKAEVQELVIHKADSAISMNGSTPKDNLINTIAVCTAGADEQDRWPVRKSLFAHVPPYISFRSHDAAAVALQPAAAKHLKWKLSTITPVVVRKTLANTGFKLVRNSNEWIGTWGKHLKSACFQTLKDSQKLNHFPGTFQIGRKDRLWKNLQRLMLKYGLSEFGFIPRTFVLPHDLKQLRQAWEKAGQDKWIIKPPASARGTGIKVIHRWSHLPKKKSLVVQQYISNPYLINGSKFDLRLYVLVTSFNPLRIYLYPDGLARFASAKYSDDVSSLGDRYMHLTNYSINKLSSQYTANEDANACKGHKWTVSKLWEYMEAQGVNTRVLWRALQQLVIKTILCGEPSISQLQRDNVASRYNCYELFGVDVLLDERLKPWLLEVNISPSLHSASPLDLHVKGPLVQTLLNLAQFHLPPKMAQCKRAPACLNTALYTTQLTSEERIKHIRYTDCETRQEYLDDILVELTGDDIRHLTQAEDELAAIGAFERVFPTRHTHRYHQFMEARYYNRLFDAWETRYERNRAAGVKLLQELCDRKLHLNVPPSPVAKAAQRTDAAESSQESCATEDVAPHPPLKMPPAQRPQPCAVRCDASK